jgi:ABC-type branched-subunit amino acid transport system ATPase component
VRTKVYIGRPLPCRCDDGKELRRIEGRTPDAVCRRGIGRTFQLVRPFPALTVEDNVVVGALLIAAIDFLHNRGRE